MASRRAFCRSFGVVTVIAGLVGCRPAEPNRIGFVGGLSGRAADLGVAGRNGAQLAVETVDAQRHERFTLLVEDDRHDPQRAAAAIASLARQNVRFIVGPMTSGVAVAAWPEIERLQVVTISPTANSDELSGRADHVFRVIADVGTGASQLAELLHDRHAGPIAALMDHGNRSYSAGFAAAAAKRYQALGGRIAAMLDYRSGPDVDFAQLARRLVDSKPKVALLVTGALDAAMVAQQLRRIDPNIGLAVTPWASGQPLLQLGGRALEGALLPMAQDPDSSAPAYVEFRRRYLDRFGENPGPPAISAYDAAMLGIEALRRQGTGRTLREVLAEPGQRWPGLQREIVLDAHGDNHNPIHLAEVRDGRMVPIRP